MRRAVWLAACLWVVLAGCASGTSPDDAGGKVKVTASFYPLAEAASRVGGDRVAVTNLTPAGAEPHDLEPRSTDIDRIEASTVLLYLGGGFQPGVEEAAGRAGARVGGGGAGGGGGGKAVDLLAPDLGLIDGFRNEEGHGGTDPHVWLDPTLMARIAERVRAVLVDADPAGQPTYSANAAAYVADLSALDAEFEQGLASCERRTIVTSHAAFGYLARRYGLVQDAVSGLDPEAEPDPKRLSELAAKVRAEGVTTIFYETLASPKVAQTLARETGAKTALLNPIEGLERDEQSSGQDYASLMRDNLAALRAALGCR